MIKTLHLTSYLTLSFSATGLAQQVAPTVGGKPLVQVKPNSGAGCKLVATFKSIKIRAGSCATIARVLETPGVAAVPPTLPEQAAAAIPQGQKQ